MRAQKILLVILVLGTSLTCGAPPPASVTSPSPPKPLLYETTEFTKKIRVIADSRISNPTGWKKQAEVDGILGNTYEALRNAFDETDILCSFSAHALRLDYSECQLTESFEYDIDLFKRAFGYEYLPYDTTSFLKTVDAVYQTVVHDGFTRNWGRRLLKSPQSSLQRSTSEDEADTIEIDPQFRSLYGFLESEKAYITKLGAYSDVEAVYNAHLEALLFLESDLDSAAAFGKLADSLASDRQVREFYTKKAPATDAIDSKIGMEMLKRLMYYPHIYKLLAEEKAQAGLTKAGKEISESHTKVARIARDANFNKETYMNWDELVNSFILRVESPLDRRVLLKFKLAPVFHQRRSRPSSPAKHMTFGHSPISPPFQSSHGSATGSYFPPTTPPPQASSRPGSSIGIFDHIDRYILITPLSVIFAQPTALYPGKLVVKEWLDATVENFVVEKEGINGIRFSDTQQKTAEKLVKFQNHKDREECLRALRGQK